MSEDYKKIALEDVKKGQRIRIVEWYPSHIAMYEGVVLKTRIDPVEIDQSEIDLGKEEGDEVTIPIEGSDGFYILLLEDVSKPKVVRTETVTVTHYDDGTKTEIPVKEEKAPTVIETMDQFDEHEEYLKQVVLKDGAGDYWTYRDGLWCWGWNWAITIVDGWKPTTDSAVIEANLPLTVVENVGD